MADIQYDLIEENLRVLGDFTIRRTDPFGFWVISVKGQKTPPSLQSSFTTAHDAKVAILNFKDSLKKGK